VIARKMADGVIEMDVTADELTIIRTALRFYAADLGARSGELEQQARSRRELSDRQLRGKHALRRSAGELEHEARALGQVADLAADLVRVISGLDRPSRSLLPMPSQIEEAHHGEE
jgi:hypothetical protein